MPIKYTPGDTGFIVESGRIIREVTVMQVAGGFCVIKFKDNGGGMRVRDSRLFPSRKSAEATLPKAPLKSRWPSN